MLNAVAFPSPLPDDPNKWDGWSKYKSANLYERLCLDPNAKPTNELIEEHCRELLRWWQKKLPLKNQPSNPLSQLLRPGLDESSRYLTEARVQLLNPERRQQMDDELAAQAHDQAVIEFHKYLAFALADGLLTPEEEKNLRGFGSDHGLSPEEMGNYIELELHDSGGRRGHAQAPARVAEQRPAVARREAAADPKDDFMRMLRLSGLDSDAMADETRDAFVNMAENLGIQPGDAEDLIDVFLEEADAKSNPAPQTPAVRAPSAPVRLQSPPAQPAASAAMAPALNVQAAASERARFADFQSSLGGQMLFVPSGELVMGSNAVEAGPDERPLTRVTLSRFFMSRHLVTNAQYEAFDPAHARKRAAGAGDRHPVVYVSSVEAIKFCQWLATRERKKFRLPTEAEWEYAARGTDGRKFPWGNYEGRGDLANFADRNTVFAWSDRDIDDGYPESSPVGAFPRGASPFGIHDMAGNVWEWCGDFYEPYRGAPKVNPKGPTSGAKRVYRGGSWKSRFNSLRTTARGCNIPGYSCNDLGFRIVCECE
jgi:formylglycine-generating enzyme required for sulfatase activity